MKRKDKELIKTIQKLKELKRKKKKKKKDALFTDEGDARILLKRYGTGNLYKSHKKCVGNIINKEHVGDKVLKKIGKVRKRYAY